MPDIILSYFSTLNDRILESRKAWYKVDSTGWVALVYAINPLSLHSLKLHACSHHFCTWVHKWHGTIL